MAIPIKDANGTTVNIRTPNENGRAAAAASEPVALSTEDLAALQTLATLLADNATGADIAAVATLLADNATGADIAALLTEAGFIARIPTLGTKAASGSVSTTPSSDQDPIYDHVNGVKATVTSTSSTAITPPAGCKYMRVHSSVDMFIRTDGLAAADAAGSIKILANQPETIPVVPATAVTAIGVGTLYATPLKVR